MPADLKDRWNQDASPLPPIPKGLSHLRPGVCLIQYEPLRSSADTLQAEIDRAAEDVCLLMDGRAKLGAEALSSLTDPILTQVADAIIGIVARERSGFAHHLIARAYRLMTGRRIHPMDICALAVRADLLRSIPLRSAAAVVESELLVKLYQRQISLQVVAVPATTRRVRRRWRDWLRAAVTMLRYKLHRDNYRTTGPALLEVMAAAPNFNRWMADVIRPYLGSSILELGAGIGNLTLELINEAEHYAATDLDSEHVHRLKNRLRPFPKAQVAVCDLEASSDFAPLLQRFDSVVCLNVLEHVADDMLALAHIRSALVRGGRAVILVPEGMSLYGSLDVVLGHYRRYSEAELRSKMERAGFRVEKVVAFNRITRPAWFLNSRVLRRRSLNRLQLRLFDLFVWLWRRLDRVLPWRPTSLIAVGLRD